MIFQANKRRAITHTTKPTETDQSQARDTDINVIVKQFLVHGQAPGHNKQPINADFTQLPTDLRGFIEMGQSLAELKAKLPDQVRELPTEELLALTPEQLLNKLTPPQPEVKKDEPK